MKTPMTKEEAIDRLRKRMDWLSMRITDARDSPQRLTYDEAERSALRFAVEHLESCPHDVDVLDRAWDRPRKPGGFISRADRGEGEPNMRLTRAQSKALIDDLGLGEHRSIDGMPDCICGCAPDAPCGKEGCVHEKATG